MSEEKKDLARRESPGVHAKDRLTHARRKLGSLLSKAGREILPRDERIPAQDINLPKVADVVFGYVFHPMNERRGLGPEKIPFDMTDVLIQLGYILPFKTDDYRRKFPEAYQKTRQQLWDLHKLGALEVKLDDEPNSHGESIRYRVTDKNLLRQIAESQTNTPSK